MLLVVNLKCKSYHNTITNCNCLHKSAICIPRGHLSSLSLLFIDYKIVPMNIEHDGWLLFSIYVLPYVWK